jgi:glycyl-tRNA synthetase beta chain
MAEFLFEIGLEEVPARMIAGAQAELQRRILAMLEHARLVPVGAANKSFSTPRRLAVWVGDVAARQQDMAEEMQGPAVKIAYKDGAPTAAALSFAKKAGVNVAALRTVATPKGEYLAATAVKAGRSAAEVIAEELPKELAGIYWAKNMYWRAGRPERFVRPVRWLLALLGGEVVPVSFGGHAAGRATRGHRVLAGDKAIEIVGRDGLAAEYEKALLAGFVIADVEARRHTIRKSLDRVCRTVPDTRWREDHALVDKLTHLTEWPTVIAGGFEREYLALPEEVLVTVMRDHQGYFAVDDLNAKLAPYFLAVLNTEADAAGEAVIRHGNERVLRARFNDARFFWEFDQRVPLEGRLELLKAVTFQKDIGSYFQKTFRVMDLSKALQGLVARHGIDIDASALEKAVRYAKTDLTSELVKEFPELQGEIGGLYGRIQGLDERIADAIYDQYRPKSMEDRIPHTVEGQLLSIADRADTIVGMFDRLLQPTGSKDPFALRRAANGIVKILGEGGIPLTLDQIISTAEGAYRKPVPAEMEYQAHKQIVRQHLDSFFRERLEFYLREAKGQAYDVVKAVLAAGANDVRDAVARAEAVTAVRGSEDFLALCAGFKRMNNILKQAGERAEEISGPPKGGFGHPAEQELWGMSGEVSGEAEVLISLRRYPEALQQFGRLRPAIDAFFEQVMVFDPDPAVRKARLWLLSQVLTSFSKIADFSEIVVAG